MLLLLLALMVGEEPPARIVGSLADANSHTVLLASFEGEGGKSRKKQRRELSSGSLGERDRHCFTQEERQIRKFL